MSAKEMFEKLGYKEVNSQDKVAYFNKKDNVRIRFYELHNQYGKSIQIEDDCHMSTFIGMKELQAINKQIEELGWDKEV